MKKSVPEIREQAVLLAQEHYNGDVLLRADQIKQLLNVLI